MVFWVIVYIDSLFYTRKKKRHAHIYGGGGRAKS